VANHDTSDMPSGATLLAGGKTVRNEAADQARVDAAKFTA